MALSPRSHLWHYHVSVAHYEVTVAGFFEAARSVGAMMLTSLTSGLERRTELLAQAMPWPLLSLGPLTDPEEGTQILSDAIRMTQADGFAHIWWLSDSGSPYRSLPALCAVAASVLPDSSVMLCCAGPVTEGEPAAEILSGIEWPPNHRYYEVRGPITWREGCSTHPCEPSEL